MEALGSSGNLHDGGVVTAHSLVAKVLHCFVEFLLLLSLLNPGLQRSKYGPTINQLLFQNIWSIIYSRFLQKQALGCLIT